MINSTLEMACNGRKLIWWWPVENLSMEASHLLIDNNSPESLVSGWPDPAIQSDRGDRKLIESACAIAFGWIIDSLRGHVFFHLECSVSQRRINSIDQQLKKPTESSADVCWLRRWASYAIPCNRRNSTYPIACRHRRAFLLSSCAFLRSQAKPVTRSRVDLLAIPLMCAAACERTYDNWHSSGAAAKQIALAQQLNNIWWNYHLPFYSLLFSSLLNCGGTCWNSRRPQNGSTTEHTCRKLKSV